MAEIDTSIYRTAPANSLSGIAEAINVANGIRQNQLGQIQLQREQMGLAAQQGVGDAYGASVDPNGNFDPSGYVRRTASGPARYLGPANVTNAAGASSAVTAAQGAGTNLSQQNQAWAASNLLPLFNDPTNPPKLTDVTGAISAGIHSGAIRPDVGAALTVEALHNGANPKNLQKWAQTKFIGTNLGASQADQGVTVSSPTGGSTALTKGQTVPAAQGGPGSAASGSAQGPGIVTNPPIGVNDVYAEAAKTKASDYASSAASLSNVRNLEAAYQKMQGLTPSDASAVGAAKNTALSAVSAFLGLPPPDSTLNYEEAKKYLEKSKANIPAAQRSDMAQHLADVSNPTLATSLAATKALTRSAIGFMRMDAAVPLAWDAAHPNEPPGSASPDYLKHRASFMNTQDPDGFAFPTLPPDEQRAIIAEKQKTGPEAFQRFRNSVGVYQQAFDKDRQ